MSLYLLMGITAGVLTLVEYIVYILSIWHRDYLLRKIPDATRPNRATWGIWTWAGIITAISYWGVGADETIWLAIANAIGFFLVFLHAIPWGEGPFDRKGRPRIVDVLALLGAVYGTWMWWQGAPEKALLAMLILETSATVPTIVKGWRDPRSENRAAWTISLMASVANVFALQWNVDVMHALVNLDTSKEVFWIALFPVWILFLVALITLPLYVRRAP